MNIPETVKMPSLSGLGKRPQGILRDLSTYCFFGFKCSFENCLWNLFITFGLSQICKIRNVWKLSSPFSMKTSFWKKNSPINSKTVIKKFFYPRLPCKSLIFTTVLGYPCKKSQNHRNPYV
jgi:hypothetical protein